MLTWEQFVAMGPEERAAMRPRRPRSDHGKKRTGTKRGPVRGGCRGVLSPFDANRFSIIYTVVGWCYNPRNKKFKDYGAKGVTIHGPWLDDYGAFFEYLKSLPNYADGTHYLRRLDLTKGYEPGNLAFVRKWARCQCGNYGSRCPIHVGGAA